MALPGTSYSSGGPIAWPHAGSDDPVTVHLSPGAAVVFYTDGLIEAHGDIDDGLRDLQQYGSELAGVPANELARSLVQRVLAETDRYDDTLAVTLRRPLTANE